MKAGTWILRPKSLSRTMDRRLRWHLTYPCSRCPLVDNTKYPIILHVTSLLHTHTHTHARARVRFNTDALKCASFCTEVTVHRNTFAERCFHKMASHTHTQTHFFSHTRTHTHTHTDTLLHRDDFALSSSTHREWCFYKRMGLHEELLYTTDIFLHRHTLA